MRIYQLQWEEEAKRRLDVVLERTLKPHTAPVTVAAIDESGTLLCTGSADSVVKIWDIRKGYITHTFKGHSGVLSALHFFVPEDTRRVAVMERKKKKTAQMFQVESNEMRHTSDSSSVFYLASGSEDGKVRIWDLVKRKAIALLDTHVSAVRGLDYSKESDLLVSASRDRTIVVWDPGTWNVVRAIPVLEVIEAVDFLCQGALIATGGEHGHIRLWNTKTGSEVTREQEARGEEGSIIQIINDSSQKSLLSVQNDHSLVFHSISNLTGKETVTEPLPEIRRISGTHDEIIDMVYLGGDHSLLALASNTESIQIISVAYPNETTISPQDLKTFFGADIAVLSGHEDIIICMSSDWSGHWLATGAKDNTARIWRIDRDSGIYEQYAVLTGHAESLGAISFPSITPPVDSHAYKSPLEHPPPFLLTGSKDSTIKHWTVPKSQNSAGRALYTRKAHDKDINTIAISPTSQLFASGSQDSTVKIWSTEEGEIQGVLRGHKRGVWSVAFAPKDAAAISGDNGTTGTNRGMILTGSSDKTVKIWSLNDYSCLLAFEGHSNSILKVLWLSPPSTPHSAQNTSPSTNPDDNGTPSRRPYQVASAGGDGLVKIWDPSSWECAATLDNHSDRVWALTVHPRTRTLVSGGGDGVITFWKDTTSETAQVQEAAASARIEQDQELSNMIRQKDYREAIVLALALDHPARLLSLFQAVMDTDPPEPGSRTGVLAVDDVLGSLSDEQLLSLLQRVRDWNTSARTYNVAQRILNVIFRKYPATRLAGLAKLKGGREVFQALEKYTERHYQRIDELVSESFILDFLLGQMGGLDVRDDAGVGAGAEVDDGEVEREDDMTMTVD